MYYVDPERQKREEEKQSEELIELHKRCVKNYLITYKSAKNKTQKKFFRLYDIYIKVDNIRNFFFKPVSVFVIALVKNDLKSIEDRISVKPKKKRRKNK